MLWKALLISGRIEKAHVVPGHAALVPCIAHMYSWNSQQIRCSYHHKIVAFESYDEQFVSDFSKNVECTVFLSESMSLANFSLASVTQFSSHIFSCLFESVSVRRLFKSLPSLVQYAQDAKLIKRNRSSAFRRLEVFIWLLELRRDAKVW